jgi:hypothetical protein
MTDTELIVLQAKQIHALCTEVQQLKQRMSDARLYIVGIGGPLNDNSLKFNAEQQMLFRKINDYLKGGSDE